MPTLLCPNCRITITNDDVRQGNCRGCGREFPASVHAELELLEAQDWYHQPRRGATVLAKILGCYFLLIGLLCSAGAAAGIAQAVQMIRGHSVPRQDLWLI